MAISEYIKWYSPSSINSFLDYRGKWYLQKVKKTEFIDNPNIVRGRTVEHGINMHYQGMPLEDCIKCALSEYDEACAPMDIDDTQAKREPIAELIECGIEALKPYGKLEDMQRRLTVPQDKIQGSQLPWVGDMDYVFEGGVIVDLKVKAQTPSSIPDGHARQGAFYRTFAAGATKMDFLYLIPLKRGVRSKVITLENHERYMGSLVAAMHVMQTLFNNVEDQEILDAIFAPSPSDFWLKDEMTKHDAKQVWNNLI